MKSINNKIIDRGNKVGDKNYSRISRINELIKREVSAILATECQDPRFKLITISEVDTSPDLTGAKIYFCTMKKEEMDKTIKNLNKASGFFRKELSRRIDIRTTPRLEFIYDDSFDTGSRINDILFSINQSKSKDNPDGS